MCVRCVRCVSAIVCAGIPPFVWLKVWQSCEIEQVDKLSFYAWQTLTKRQHDQQEAIWELLQTELSYINQIRVIIDVSCATFTTSTYQALSLISSFPTAIYLCSYKPTDPAYICVHAECSGRWWINNQLKRLIKIFQIIYHNKIFLCLKFNYLKVMFDNKFRLSFCVQVFQNCLLNIQQEALLNEVCFTGVFIWQFMTLITSIISCDYFCIMSHNVDHVMRNILF